MGHAARLSPKGHVAAVRHTWEEFEERLRQRERAEEALRKQYSGAMRARYATAKDASREKGLKFI